MEKNIENETETGSYIVVASSTTFPIYYASRVPRKYVEIKAKLGMNLRRIV